MISSRSDLSVSQARLEVGVEEGGNWGANCSPTATQARRSILVLAALCNINLVSSALYRVLSPIQVGKHGDGMDHQNGRSAGFFLMTQL